MPSSRIQLTDDLSFSRTIPGLMRVRNWDYSPSELLDWIKQCLDMGVTTFDNANIYGGFTAEAAFGEALALEPSLRDKMELVTKCDILFPNEAYPHVYLPHYDTTHDHIIASAERSLRKLQTETIDVLLIHRPDPLMDADEVASAFTALHEAGKVRYFGVSNFLPQHMDLLQSRLDTAIVTNQVEVSVTYLDHIYNGTLDYCQQHRITPMAWSPVGGGRLFTSDDDRSVRLRETMQRIGNNLGGTSIDQVALAWLLQHPSKIAPVLGTGKIERVRAAVEAESLPMTRQQWFEILVASQGHNVP
ncbi:MAG: aldo/keto reductase [Anaerolineae bacterium]|nr:aldo/keto reductase [Anaerolineae bacterium]